MFNDWNFWDPHGFFRTLTIEGLQKEDSQDGVNMVKVKDELEEAEKRWLIKAP